MHILDTDALSAIQRGTGGQFEKLAAYLDHQDDVWVTVISLHEQISGALSLVSKGRLVDGYRLLLDLHHDFAARPILAFDAAAQAVLDQIRRMKGLPSAMDLRIAAIALRHDATLVTGNVKDFESIPDLKLHKAW